MYMCRLILIKQKQQALAYHIKLSHELDLCASPFQLALQKALLKLRTRGSSSGSSLNLPNQHTREIAVNSK